MGTEISRLKPAEWAVLLFTIVYVAIFFSYFLLIGNYEFIWCIFPELFP